MRRRWLTPLVIDWQTSAGEEHLGRGPVSASFDPAYADYPGVAQPASTARGTRTGGMSIAGGALGRVPAICAFGILLTVFYAYFDDAIADTLTVATFVLAIFVAVRLGLEFRDWLNPMTVILAMAIARLALPGVSLFDPDWAPPIGTLSEDFGIFRYEAIQGTHLAAIGVLGVIFGWYVSPSWLARPPAWVYRQAARMRAEPALVPAATLVLVAGIIAGLIYLGLSGGNPITAIISGVAKGTTAEGSSRYGYFAIATLTTASLILTLYRAHDARRSLRSCLLPSIFATIFLTTFGGRVGALTPVAVSFVGAYYIRKRVRRTESSGPRGGRLPLA